MKFHVISTCLLFDNQSTNNIRITAREVGITENIENRLLRLLYKEIAQFGDCGIFFCV